MTIYFDEGETSLQRDDIKRGVVRTDAVEKRLNRAVFCFSEC